MAEYYSWNRPFKKKSQNKYKGCFILKINLYALQVFGISFFPYHK